MRVLPKFQAVAAMLFVAAGFSALSDAAEIVLQPTSGPISGVIRLGDIAEIQDEDVKTVERLRKIPLMPAPSDSGRQTITANQVRDWLAIIGEDMTELQFSGSPRVMVSNDESVSNGTAPGPRERRLTSRRPTNDSVTSALTRSRSRRSILTARDRKALQEGFQSALTDHITVSSGEEGPWEIKAELTPNNLRDLQQRNSPVRITGGNRPWQGKQVFTVKFSTPTGTRQFQTVAIISKPQLVVVATQPIDAGRIITAADVELAHAPSKGRLYSTRSAAKDVEQVAGYVARRAFREGDVIRVESVRAPMLIRRGESVQAIARGGGIRVQTYALARNDGLAGDVIEVESLGSKERYYAKVIGRGKVEVFAGGSPNGN